MIQMRTLLLLIVLALPLAGGLYAADAGNAAPGDSESTASAAPSAEDTPEAAQKRENSRTVTWITLGILVGILGLGVLAKSRINRSNQSADAEPSGDDA